MSGNAVGSITGGAPRCSILLWGASSTYLSPRAPEQALTFVQLSRILRLMAQSSTSGLPDLCLWSAGGEGDNADAQAMLVEVKGPRDRLSDKQRVWIDLLLKAGVRVAVCKIEASVV